MTQTEGQTPNFFNEGSPFLKHPLLTAERTIQEIDFIVSELGLSPGARILDVGCGFGRHSIELARRGYDVSGIDPSPAMIGEARERANEMGVNVDFQQLKGEHFVTTQLFDVALCLFTTLGQITEAGDNLPLPQQVHEALKPGGYFLVEVPQRETAVRQMKPQETMGKGERVAHVTRHFDPNSNILSEEFRLVDNASESVYLLQVRLFEQDELTRLLEEAGYEIKAVYGSWQGSELRDEDSMMLLVAKKAG